MRTEGAKDKRKRRIFSKGTMTRGLSNLNRNFAKRLGLDPKTGKKKESENPYE